MANNLTIVLQDISLRAEQLCARGNFIEGVEIMLMNNLYKADGPVVPVPGSGQKDVSALLKRALGHLARTPFDTLGVSIDASMIDVRKAYKKLALK